MALVTVVGLWFTETTGLSREGGRLSSSQPPAAGVDLKQSVLVGCIIHMRCNKRELNISHF